MLRKLPDARRHVKQNIGMKCQQIARTQRPGSISVTRTVWKCSGAEFEACMANELDPGAPLGPFVPVFNDCKSWVEDTLMKCCKVVKHRFDPWAHFPRGPKI